MESIGEPIKILLSLVLGGLIGLEREMNEKMTRNGKKPIAIVGVRSFSLIGALGAISGIMYTVNPFFASFIAIFFALLTLIFYILDTRLTKATGITTELALIYSFIIGVLIALEILPIQLTLAISVILILLLSKKDTIRKFVKDIRQGEINALISYAVIAVVILPFLPNETYALSDIPQLERILQNFGFTVERLGEIEVLNPFSIWLIVALITGIDLLGYILERTLGQQKGWILASVAGGFISSTATTQSLSQQSKETKGTNHLVAAALIANLASFFSIILLLAALNTPFMIRVLPVLGSIILAAGLSAFYFLKKKEKKRKKKSQVDIAVGTHEIFSLSPALKFAGVFLAVNILSKVSLEFFGEGGFFVTNALGALVGLTAVVVNTADLAGTVVNAKTAVIAFILANAVNLLAKTIYSFFQGTREFTLKFFISVISMIAASLFGLIFV